MNKLKPEHIENFLETLVSNGNPELSGVIVYPADGRLGKKAAFALCGEHGVINTISGFMTYSEMNQVLLGYMFKAENRFVQK